MYQVYTLPKYIEHGKKFFQGVTERYTQYAKELEPKIGIPYTVITPLIFILCAPVCTMLCLRTSII